MIFSENATIHMKNDHILVFSRNNFLLETSQPNTETFHKAMCIEFKIVMHEKAKTASANHLQSYCKRHSKFNLLQFYEFI